MKALWKILCLPCLITFSVMNADYAQAIAPETATGEVATQARFLQAEGDVLVQKGRYVEAAQAFGDGLRLVENELAKLEISLDEELDPRGRELAEIRDTLAARLAEASRQAGQGIKVTRTVLPAPPGGEGPARPGLFPVVPPGQAEGTPAMISPLLTRIFVNMRQPVVSLDALADETGVTQQEVVEAFEGLSEGEALSAVNEARRLAGEKPIEVIYPVGVGRVGEVSYERIEPTLRTPGIIERFVRGQEPIPGQGLPAAAVGLAAPQEAQPFIVLSPEDFQKVERATTESDSELIALGIRLGGTVDLLALKEGARELGQSSQGVAQSSAGTSPGTRASGNNFSLQTESALLGVLGEAEAPVSLREVTAQMVGMGFGLEGPVEPSGVVLEAAERLKQRGLVEFEEGRAGISAEPSLRLTGFGKEVGRAGQELALLGGPLGTRGGPQIATSVVTVQAPSPAEFARLVARAEEEAAEARQILESPEFGNAAGEAIQRVLGPQAAFLQMSPFVSLATPGQVSRITAVQAVAQSAVVETVRESPVIDLATEETLVRGMVAVFEAGQEEAVQEALIALAERAQVERLAPPQERVTEGARRTLDRILRSPEVPEPLRLIAFETVLTTGQGRVELAREFLADSGAPRTLNLRAAEELARELGTLAQSGKLEEARALEGEVGAQITALVTGPETVPPRTALAVLEGLGPNAETPQKVQLARAFAFHPEPEVREASLNQLKEVDLSAQPAEEREAIEAVVRLELEDRPQNARIAEDILKGFGVAPTDAGQGQTTTGLSIPGVPATVLRTKLGRAVEALARVVQDTRSRILDRLFAARALETLEGARGVVIKPLVPSSARIVYSHESLVGEQRALFTEIRTEVPQGAIVEWDSEDETGIVKALEGTTAVFILTPAEIQSSRFRDFELGTRHQAFGLEFYLLNPYSVVSDIELLNELIKVEDVRDIKDINIRAYFLALIGEAVEALPPPSIEQERLKLHHIRIGNAKLIIKA
ncbi:MAG: hypothetical protein HYY14_02070 [Candidatus Omnitrophica bacterium]|nr:hypothetical protein [Candidatus Omnitrophota bacterium]